MDKLGQVKEFSKTKGFISGKFVFRMASEVLSNKGKITSKPDPKVLSEVKNWTKLLCSCPLPLHLSMWLKLNVGSLFCKENVQNFAGHPFQTQGPRTCLSISRDFSIAITAPYLTSIACLVNIQTQKVKLLSIFLTSHLWFRV